MSDNRPEFCTSSTTTDIAAPRPNASPATYGDELLASIRTAERERCAKMLEEEARHVDSAGMDDVAHNIRTMVALIRAMGDRP